MRLHAGLLLNQWLNALGGLALGQRHDSLCKLYVVSVTLSSALSPWMLVAMAGRRAVSVVWPHRAAALALRSRGPARLVVGVIVGVLFLAYAHAGYGFALRVDRSGRASADRCLLVPDRGYQVFYYYFQFLSNALTSYVPFALLLAFNSVLVWAVARSVRAARERLTSGGGQGRQSQAAAIRFRERQASSMTVTLIAVSVSFIVLSLPITVIGLVYKRPAYRDYRVGLVEHILAHEMATVVFRLMWYCAAAVNFYLYMLTGTKFRAEFKRLFAPCCQAARSKERSCCGGRGNVGGGHDVNGGGGDVERGAEREGE